MHPAATPEYAAPGDSPHAWDCLIDALNPPALLLVVERRMSALLRQHITPEDILQDALLHAWRDRAHCEWRGLRAFRAWFLTLIDNRIREAVDHHGAQKRGRGRRPLPFSALAGNSTNRDCLAGPDIPQSTTPSRIAVHREQAEAIRAALAELPDELREIVRLRLIEQLPIDTIAARLRLGPSAVRHRFRRGAEIYASRLRDMLASRTVSTADHPRRPPGRIPLSMNNGREHRVHHDDARPASEPG